MTDEDTDKEGMAECGACRAVVPVDSTECPGCGVSFTGVSDTSLGECGACGALVPLDSRSCSQCGVVFVADDVIQILADWLNATGLSVVDLFKRFDTNGDGVIEAQEFKTGLLALNIADLPESQVNRLVEALDDDGNGVIDLEELESTFTPPDNQPLKEVGPSQKSSQSESSQVEESQDSKDDEEPEVESEDDSGDEEESEEDEEVPTEEDDSLDEEDSAEAEDVSPEDEDEDDSEDEDEIEDVVPDTPLGRMIKSFKDSGYNAQAAFEHMDVNNDGEIDKDELKEALTQFGGGVISDEDVEEVMNEVDFDENGTISIEELVAAFGEEFEIIPEETSEQDEVKVSESKEFPTELQKKLMSKKANDVFWPIMHSLFGLFMILWIANGLGVFVDGEGGNIIHSGESFIDDNGNVVNDGDSTACDPKVGHECSNSLTPLSGDGAGSMPAGFYWDGILMIILGAIGLGGSLYAHLVLMKEWRARVKKDSGDSDKDSDSDDDSEDGEEDNTKSEDGKEDSDDEDDEDSDDEDDEDSDEEDDEDSDDEDDEDSDDKDDEDSDEDDEEEDIDIGSRVGVELDGEEIFGVIIEFDDDADTVIIEDEETGDEIEAPQDSMFLE